MRRLRASVLLMAVAMITILVVAAYGFLVSTRLNLDAGRSGDLGRLAQVAARAGLAHACAELDREFLSTPGMPTHLRQRWRSAFLPIDAYGVGKATATTNDDAPQGQEFSPEDANGNDTPTENLLTELHALHLQKTSQAEIGAYFARASPFRSGARLHPGGGRWIEPGRFHRDLPGRPISFHLRHPQAADAASADPAVARGEPYAPDVDAPLLLGSDLTRAADRDRARFRLRYAVAIEDLTGHLLAAVQGGYDPALASAAGGLPVPDLPGQDPRRAFEIDALVAERYADAFTGMCNVTTGAYSFWGWLSWQGLGARPTLSGVDTADASYAVLRRFQGGIPQIAVDYDYAAAPPAGQPDLRSETAIVPTVAAMHHGLLGPPHSYEAMQAPNGYADNARNVSSLFTPFGRAPRPSAPAGRWDGGQVDTPWRLNLPTASPRAVAAMLYAYLPQEFYTILYTTRTRQPFAGFDAQGNATWGAATTEVLSPAVRRARPCMNLFNSRPPFSGIFAHLGHGYPGSEPEAGWMDWDEDLGASVDVDDLRLVVAPSGDLRLYARPPLWGQGANFGGLFWDIGDDVVEKQEQFAGGERWVLQLGGTTVPPRKGNGLAYDSYWCDLASAFVHAVAVAQYAWLGENGASWNGAPAAGTTRYPAGWADYPALAGQPTLDLDLDGDGVADVPSLFDSIAEVDAQFVKNMGEYPEDLPSGSRPGSASVASVPRIGHPGLYLRKATHIAAPATLVTGRPANTIKSLLLAPRGLPDPATAPAPPPITAAQAAAMELVLNDMRLSFFGSSPQYPGFRPIDFDDDGRACCSGYAGGSAPADPATGKGPAPDADRIFSLTGHFVMQKSRFWRITCRGEVFDEVRQRTVADADLEAAYCLDPDGEQFDLGNAAIPGAGPLSTRLLHQRWLWNRYKGARSRADAP